MTWRLSYLIPFLFSLVFTSKVTFEYNTIATYKRIGMVGIVKDREERCLIKIQQGAMEKATKTRGCVIKTNDTRLRLSCIQTGNDVMLSINLTYPDSSDMGTWHCSDGNSYDTVTLHDFLKYPKQPAILLRNHEAESNLGPYEMHCVSESRSQLMFTRNKLSFTWRLNGHSLTDLQPCFRLSGHILTLCLDACGLGEDDNISVTCTAEEDGLVSKESQSFFVPVSRAISEEPARSVNMQDDGAKQTTWRRLVGALIGSVVTGAILSISLKFLVSKIGGFCKKEQRQEERNYDVPGDTMYVISVIMQDTKPEGKVSFRPTQNDNENTYEAI